MMKTKNESADLAGRIERPAEGGRPHGSAASSAVPAHHAAQDGQRPAASTPPGGLLARSKKLLTAALLLFVAAAVVRIVVREAKDNRAANGANAAAADRPLPDDGVVAYYFHGNTRCPTCRKIERYAHQAVASPPARSNGGREQAPAGRSCW